MSGLRISVATRVSLKQQAAFRASREAAPDCSPEPALSLPKGHQPWVRRGNHANPEGAQEKDQLRDGLLGHWRTTNLQSRFRVLQDNQASQLLELAVALPLLIVFIVGIFDFGQAFNLKQKLNTAVREGARHGSSLPTNDLTTTGIPPTVTSVRDVVDTYLRAAKVNDCGLNGQAGAAGTTPLSWTFTASSGCSGSLTVTVERGYSFPAVINPNTFNVISTRVTIRYPYQWQFNRVITLLVPGATYAGQTLITTDATVANVD